MTLRILLPLCILMPGVISAQWAPVNVGTSSTLSCVDYSTSQKIIIGGAGRSVISTDGGATWNTQLVTDTFGNVLGPSHIYDMHYLGGTTYNLSGMFFGPNSQTNFRSHNDVANCYWTYLNNSGSNPKVFWDSDFVNSLTGYACGTHGRITKTADGGLTWILQSTPATTELYGIDFVNATTGTAVGDFRILHTTDGGTTWNAQTTTWALRSMHFPTTTVGYACGGNGIVLKSTDAGATWNPLPISNLSSNTYSEIWFTSQDTGYMVSGGAIFKTVDGGLVWTYTIVGNVGTLLRSIHFLDANNGYAVGANGEVFRTINAGGPSPGTPMAGFTTSQIATCGNTQLNATNISGGAYTTQWLLNGNPYSTSYSTSFSFTSTTTATVTLIISNACCADTVTSIVNVSVQQPNPVVAGNNQNFCGSAVPLTASGTGTFSWSPTSGLSNPNIANPLASPTVTTTYTVTLTNAVCVSTDDVLVTAYPVVTNEVWDPDTMPITPGDPARSVLFIDANHGFAVQNGGIHKTVNGGATWTNSLLTSLGNQKGRIAYTSYTNWFVAADVLRQTTDAGTTWTVNPLNGITLNSGDDVDDVFFTDALTGYILINDNFTFGTRIAKTTNAGTTWTICFSNTNEKLVSIYGVDNDTVFCTGHVIPSPNYLRSYKTYNGGASWQPMTISSPAGTIAYEVEFLTASYGYVVGYNYLYQTQDGGATWSTFNMPGVLCIEIINHDTVFAGVGNRIFKTFTAGACWADMGQQTLNYVWDLCFPNRQYVVGYFGTAMSFVGQRSVVRKTIPSASPQLAFTLSDSICFNDPFTAYNGSYGYSSFQWFVDNTFVSANQDYTATLPQGVYQIMLVGTYSTGIDSIMQTLTVIGVPTVALSLNNPTVCTSTSAFLLSGGTPTGGTYSGPGIVNGVFNPATTGPGVYAITYTAGITSCISSAVDSIQVLAAPSSTLVLNDSVICYPHSSFILTGGSPAGGTYSGTAVTGGSFDPITSGPGSFLITYTTTNGVCNATSIDTIQVLATPIPSLTLTDSLLCLNSNSVVLSGGNPVGGIFSGIGVSSGNFYPALTGVGSFEISYTVSNGICYATTTDSIEVVSPPVVTVTLVDSVLCETASSIVLAGGVPGGGTYNGPGVSSGVFDPLLTGSGIFTITYTVSDSVCSAFSTDLIDVTAQPVATLSLLDSIVCHVPSTVVLSGGNPSGGVYSGPGVIGGNFDPMITGPGTFPITYTVSDSVCASSIVTDTILVDICNNVEELALNDIVVYPNPSSGIFTIQNFSGEFLTYAVEDMSGRIVYSGSIIGNISEDLNFSGPGAGTYILKILRTSTGEMEVHKLIRY